MLRQLWTEMGGTWHGKLRNGTATLFAKLYDVASRKSNKQAQASTALGGDPRSLFDRLAQQLLDIEGFGRASTVQLAQATTSSLAAYRAYLDGVKLLNSWRLREADEQLAKATALDSTFALAYHKRALGIFRRLGQSLTGGADRQTLVPS